MPRGLWSGRGGKLDWGRVEAMLSELAELKGGAGDYGGNAAAAERRGADVDFSGFNPLN